jgi:hypothetical protein
MSGFVLGVRILRVAVFGVAGVAKLADRKGTREVLEAFGVPALDKRAAMRGAFTVRR